MARNVNVWTSEWCKTGRVMSVPQYSMKVRMQWTDDAGKVHDETKVVLYPDSLTEIALNDADWVNGVITETLMQTSRKALAVDAVRSVEPIEVVK